MEKNIAKKRSLLKKRFKADNSGSTILVVIVALALLGILSALVLYTTYINLSMKTTEARATDNFYSGEMAMEEIKAGLEQEVSTAFSGAYMTVMQNYSSYDEVGRITRFQSIYLDKLQTVLQDPMDPTRFNTEKLESYISATDQVVLAEASVESLVKYSDSVHLKGVQLTYTDERGYVAVISTDIVLKIPNVTFSETRDMPDMLSYVIIADDVLDFTNTGISEVSGSVYGGENGIVVGNGMQVVFSEADTLTTGGDLTVTGSESSVRTASGTNLWVQGVTVESGTVDLNGNIYVQDDLTVNGRGSHVLLSGSYYGYGYSSVTTTDYGPANSSSILINGAGTYLDMSGLNKLVLAGQAYIGTRDRDLDGDGEIDSYMGEMTVGGNSYSSASNDDVRMGQSFAVKTDQLAYLIPAQCIHLRAVSGGEVVYENNGSNPLNILTFNEYQGIKAAYGLGEFAEVELSLMVPGFSQPLSDYGAGVQRVFYQAAGASNAWVYYYLSFSSSEQANRFFHDYFNANTEFLTNYMSNYLAEFIAPADFGRLNLAGNMVMYNADSDTYTIQASTTTNDAVTEYGLMIEYNGYRDTYQALNVNLSRNYGALTEAQRAKTVFYNTIDVDMLRTYMTENGASGPLRVSGSGYDIVLVDNDANDDGVSESVYTIPSDSSIRVVIATGDVIVNTNFRGLIISGGSVYVQNGANITSDPEGVSIALQADHCKVLDCFVESEALAGSADSDEDPGDATEADDTITTDSLVSYRNWQKE